MNEYWDAWTRLMFAIHILHDEKCISSSTSSSMENELMTLKTLVLSGDGSDET